jgi:hypothetical protein
MSSMVDSRPQTVESECPHYAGAGVFGSLVKARFVSVAAVVAAALSLGFGSGAEEESRGKAAAEMPSLRLDPNTVPPQVLTALPHVGSALVDRWVKAREERPFRSLEDARARVRGFGAATLEQVAPYFVIPNGRLLDEKPMVSRKTSRLTAQPRTAVRKKSGSKKVSTTEQPRVAANSPQHTDL